MAGSFLPESRSLLSSFSHQTPSTAFPSQNKISCKTFASASFPLLGFRRGARSSDTYGHEIIIVLLVTPRTWGTSQTYPQELSDQLRRPFGLGFCCCCSVAQTCTTFCDPMDCSPPDSSIHGILQARVLEWLVIPSFRGSSQPRDGTRIICVSCIAGGFFTN